MHFAVVVEETVKRFWFRELDHSLYKLYLILSDYNLFHKRKSDFCGKRFNKDDDDG